MGGREERRVEGEGVPSPVFVFTPPPPCPETQSNKPRNESLSQGFLLAGLEASSSCQMRPRMSYRRRGLGSDIFS